MAGASADGAPKPPSRLSFIVLSNPADARDPAARRLVRSQAARESQPTRRRPRKPRASAASSSPGLRQQQRRPGIADEEEAAVVVALPDPKSLLTSASRGDPFDSFARRLSVLEQYLIDQYVTVFLPTQACPHDSWQVMDRASYLRLAARDWVGFLLTDTGLVCGLLLSASRQASLLYDPAGSSAAARKHFEYLALQYKVQALRSASKSVAGAGKGDSTQVTDVTIAKALALALDEICLGDMAALRRHILAIRKMVQLRGGTKALGLNGFLDITVREFVEPEWSPIRMAQLSEAA